MKMADNVLKYPTYVAFILAIEFCERFTSYGLRAVLTLYLRDVLLFEENLSTILYHIFVMLCYLTPILGAILADTYLDKFRTILYFTMIHMFGNVVLSVAAIPDLLPQKLFSLAGLLIIALGTGGIKPCVSALGGDQFVQPEQNQQLEHYFSVFFWTTSCGCTIAALIAPYLRQDVKCFDQDSCFSLTFFFPALLMCIAIALFATRKSCYTIKKPENNMLRRFFGCITYAVKCKFFKKNVKDKQHNHWLEFASDEYDEQLIEDVKKVLRVGSVFLPLPVFWALYDQQGSRWTFQATRMNGHIGSFIILPDQMQIICPLMVLMLVPLFDTVVYPCLNRCGSATALKRIGCGLFLCGLSFVGSGIVELNLEPTYERIPDKGFTQLNFINTVACPVNVTYMAANQAKSFQLNATSLAFEYDLENGPIRVETTVAAMCGSTVFRHSKWSGFIAGSSAKGYSVIITVRDEDLQVTRMSSEEHFEKSAAGEPRLRLLLDDLSSPSFDNGTVYIESTKAKYNFFLYNEESTNPNVTNLISTDVHSVEIGMYDVFISQQNGTIDYRHPVGNIFVASGGCYTCVIQRPADNSLENHVLITAEVTPANSIHILWLIPQYFLMTVAEIIFSVTGVAFSFTQAPASMKSVMQAMWALIVSCGNVFVILVIQIRGIERKATEFFVFAGIMGAATVVFAALASRYTYVNARADNVALENLENSTSNKKHSIDAANSSKSNHIYSQVNQ